MSTRDSHRLTCGIDGGSADAKVATSPGSARVSRRWSPLRLPAIVVVSALLLFVSTRCAICANAPEVSELVRLNSRIARASGIRVITGIGVFEGRGAWVDSAGLHLMDAPRRFDASAEGGPEVLRWDQVSEVRIRRSHAREGAWTLGSIGGLLFGAAGVFAAGFTDNPNAGTTAGYAVGMMALGGAEGGGIGALLGWGTHGWKRIWKDGRSTK